MVLDWEPDMSGKLEPVYVPADDVDIYGVEEEGWYVVDETFQVFSGPFTSHKDCLGAIKETDKPQAA
jgi:hypothetical protein